ncbi:hypothetical protein AB0N95_01380 [Streptomyces microflavus]|uniref:hypothetical protein n=1 Tax=Streptomyces microflavus TaxID=1919 RepID=UPI00341736C7
MNVEDLVQERIAAARRKIANDKRRREELAEARKYGIAARHRQKLARLSRYSPGPARETPADSKTPLTNQRPARARGTGHGPISLTHARETEKGDAR